MSRLPQNLLGLTLLVPSVSKDFESSPLADEVTLVIFRWDRYDYLGWSESFIVTLTFPDERVYEVEVPPSLRLLDGHSIRVPIDSGTNLRERPQQKCRTIPRIVFNLSAPLNKQLSQDVRRLLKNVRRMTDLVQCTSLYFVIEDEAGRREVEASGITNFPQAYNALRSGAYKADLLRYYLLHKYGGVYLDDKTFLRHSLDSLAFDHIFGGGTTTDGQPCDMFIGTSNTTEIAFMSARPGSPVMLKALETAINNVMERLYTNHRLGITGNLMFNKVFLSDNSPIHQSIDSEIRERWEIHSGEKVALLPITPSDERIMFGNDILWQRQAIPSADWPKPATYYANLWGQRLVYTDGNPPPPIHRLRLSAETKREIIAYALTLLAFVAVGFLISRYPSIEWL